MDLGISAWRAPILAFRGRRRRATTPRKTQVNRDTSTYPWYIKALCGIGIVSLTGVILALFFSIGRRPAAIRPTEGPPVGSPAFLTALAGAAGAPIRAGGTIELLNNGDEFFPSLFAAIRGAKRSITFSVYIWEPGRVSDQTFDALVERAQAGVQVRVLLDGLGGWRAPEDDINRLKAAGGRVETFRPARFGKLARFYKRNHRRAIVIDGRIAFTGGMAIGDKWLGNATTDEEWRDTMVRVTGPMASTVQSAFIGLWASSTGELLVGEAFFPQREDDTSSRASSSPVHVGLASSPAGENHSLRLFLVQSFFSAARRIYITTPYFVPDKSTREAVMDASRRGVDVRLLLPNSKTDAKPIRWTSQSHYEALLAAGVRIFEYEPTMMHAKGIVIDGRWSIVGSANMDIRSKELNEENVLGVLDHDFAAAMERTFAADLRKTHEVRLEPWRRRGSLQRFKERAASLFAEQY